MDAAERVEPQQVVVTRHDETRIARDGALQDAIVVRVITVGEGELRLNEVCRLPDLRGRPSDEHPRPFKLQS